MKSLLSFLLVCCVVLTYISSLPNSYANTWSKSPVVITKDQLPEYYAIYNQNVIFITNADKEKISIIRENKNATKTKTGGTVFHPWIMSVDSSLALHPGDTILFSDDTGYNVWAIISHNNNQVQYEIYKASSFSFFEELSLSIGNATMYQNIGNGKYIEYDLNFDLPTDPKLTKRSLMTIPQYIDLSSREVALEWLRRKSKLIVFYYRKGDPRYAKLDKSILDNLHKIPSDTVILKRDYATRENEDTLDTVMYMDRSGKVVRKKIKANSLQNLLRRR